MDKLYLYQQMKQELEVRKRTLQNQLDSLNDVEAQRASLNEGIALIDAELLRYNDFIKSAIPKGA